MTTASPTRVLIADDHPIFCEGVARTIERHPEYVVLGRAPDGAEAFSFIREQVPEIAILDMDMPKMNGLDVARKVFQEAIHTDLIILTLYKEPAYFHAAMDLGVRGYLLKDSVTDDLIRCLNAVTAGHHYISSSISDLMIQWHKHHRELLTAVPALQRLTPAERSVLRLLGSNLTSRQIADTLCISIRTVENHRFRIGQKLELSGPHKLLQFAIEHHSELS